MSVAAVRALERHAIDEVGLPGTVLMENAGAGAARVALELLAGEPLGATWVLAGGGNNGGDGWVVARHLLVAGRGVRVFSAVDPDDLPADARTMARAARAYGVPCEVVTSSDRWRALAEAGAVEAALVVDGLLGTGARGPARPPVADALRAFESVRVRRRADRPAFLALDVPSGLAAEPGTAAGAVLGADVTVTFGAPKSGLLDPGLTGRLVVLPIGIPFPAG